MINNETEGIFQTNLSKFESIPYIWILIGKEARMKGELSHKEPIMRKKFQREDTILNSARQQILSPQWYSAFMETRVTMPISCNLVGPGETNPIYAVVVEIMCHAAN